MSRAKRQAASLAPFVLSFLLTHAHFSLICIISIFFNILLPFSGEDHSSYFRCLLCSGRERRWANYFPLMPKVLTLPTSDICYCGFHPYTSYTSGGRREQRETTRDETRRGEGCAAIHCQLNREHPSAEAAY